MKLRTRTWLKGVCFVAGLLALCAWVWVQSRGGAGGLAGRGGGAAGLGRSFQFDLERHLDEDPALLLYTEAPAIPVPSLELLSAFAEGPDGKLLVGGGRVWVMLDPRVDGEVVRRIDVGGEIRALAVDADGRILAGVDNHIEQFDSEGRLQAVWEPPVAASRPMSIVCRGEDVFVGDAYQEQVLRYDRGGELLERMGGFVLFSSTALGMDVDGEGNLWVANPGKREIRSYDRVGVLRRQWSRPGRAVAGFSGCCNPVDLAIRPDGAIVTSEKNIVRVKVLSREGELVGLVAGPRSFDQTLSDLKIRVDREGRVLVLDPVQKAIRVFVEKEQ